MIEFVVWLGVALVAVPVLTFAVECLAGGPRRDVTAASEPPPYAVLMPAHDEAVGIAAAVTRAQAQLRPVDRLIVVADNCGDATATLARQLGAEVVERFDARRGKGFALAAGREVLVADPPALVIVLDADCWPEPGALPRLAARAASTGAAVQGRYLLAASDLSDPAVRLSNFAFAVKNLVRQRGLARLGAPALLQGTGMAFPWPVFATARLASPSLVEDLELGLALVLAGGDVRFAPEAGFLSPASSRSATIGQRTRWEHGSLATGLRHVPALLAGSLGRPGLLVLALDLLVPPLALLALLQLTVLIVAALLALSGGSSAPLLVAVASTLLLAAGLGLAWRHAGEHRIAPAALLRIPGYILWKLPIYGRLLVDRQRAWVRTSRDG